MPQGDSCPYCEQTECEHLFYIREGEIGRIYGIVKTREEKFLAPFEDYLRSLKNKGQAHIIGANKDLRVYSVLSCWQIIEGLKNNDVESDFCSPPNFTLYPNPYLPDFIQRHLQEKPYNPEKDSYYREPYITDIKQGKNTPLYNAHPFHTKVPPQAIEKFIGHYTEPGDLILDPFAGSGMTGVAALGKGRKAILVELSPIANFIAYNYCTASKATGIEEKAKQMLDKIREELDYLYETRCRVCGGRARIEYVVWSDKSRHPLCGKELDLWDVAVNRSTLEVSKNFACPNCNIMVKRGNLSRIATTPVLVSYTCLKSHKQKKSMSGKKKLSFRFECQKLPRRDDEVSSFDAKKLEDIERKWVSIQKNAFYPTENIMFIGPRWGDTYRAGYHSSMNRVDHFYTTRNLWALCKTWLEISRLSDKSTKDKLRWVFTSICLPSSRLNRYNFKKRGNSPLSGTLYVPAFHAEENMERNFISKARAIERIASLTFRSETFIISTQSATDIANIPDNSVDYVFTDPPYGSNLMYSELDFLWESWLGWFTDLKDEAIVNRSQGKGLAEYKDLMLRSFCEIYRVLKPKRYLTLAFNNSNPNIWNAIQDALKEAGFVVVSQHIFDNKQRTFKALKYGKVLKGYVIINCIKPLKPVVRATVNGRITEGNALEFVTERLGDLPLTLSPARTADSLWGDLAGKAVKLGYYLELNSLEFKQMLERETQIGRLKAVEAENEQYYYLLTQQPPTQLKLIAIRNEKEAIEWLRDFLLEPKTSGEIAPHFNASLHPEARLDLLRLLEDNFVLVGDKWRKPIDKSEEENIKKQAHERRLKEFEKWMKEILSDPNAKILSLTELRWGFRYLLDVSRYDDIVRLFQYLKEEQKRDRELKKVYARARAMTGRYAREKEAKQQERLLRFLR